MKLNFYCIMSFVLGIGLALISYNMIFRKRDKERIPSFD